MSKFTVIHNSTTIAEFDSWIDARNYCTDNDLAKDAGNAKNSLFIMNNDYGIKITK